VLLLPSVAPVSYSCASSVCAGLFHLVDRRRRNDIGGRGFDVFGTLERGQSLLLLLLLLLLLFLLLSLSLSATSPSPRGPATLFLP